jgi:hypothetical protein
LKFSVNSSQCFFTGAPKKCTISSAGIIRPVFLNNTVNTEGYLKLLQDHFVSNLQGMGVNMEKYI